MNIDICRNCPNWREYLYMDDSTRARCIVELRCDKCGLKWNIRMENLDEHKVEDLIKSNNRHWLCHDVPEYKTAFENCEEECHLKLEKIIENQRTPSICKYRVEQTMEKWNAEH